MAQSALDKCLFEGFYAQVRNNRYGEVRKRKCLRCGKVGGIANGNRICPTCSRTNSNVGKAGEAML